MREILNLSQLKIRPPVNIYSANNWIPSTTCSPGPQVCELPVISMQHVYSNSINIFCKGYVGINWCSSTAHPRWYRWLASWSAIRGSNLIAASSFFKKSIIKVVRKCSPWWLHGQMIYHSPTYHAQYCTKILQSCKVIILFQSKLQLINVTTFLKDS